MLYALEVIASVYGGPFSAAMKEALLLEGERGISFLGSHATMDAKHMAELRLVLNTLHDDDGARGASWSRRSSTSTTSPASSKSYEERPHRPSVPQLLGRPYKYLRLEWNSELSLLRVRTFVKPIQCYSLAGLAEMQRVLDDITANPGAGAASRA